MQRDAELAIAELGPLSPLRAVAQWLLASSHLVKGDFAEADAQLILAIEATGATGATFAEVTALAQMALIALDGEDDGSATMLAKQARAIVDEGEFENYLPLALLGAVEGRLSIRSGDTEQSRFSLAGCERLRPLMSRAVPFYCVQTLTEMARAYLALGDLAAARAVLLNASEIIRQRPDLGVLVDGVTQLRAQAATGFEPAGSGLTAAELRLLPLLTTHLTFPQIAKRLYLSRNTVKTQGTSIYRKLGVTSRSAAVLRAAELGLVEIPSGRERDFTRSG